MNKVSTTLAEQIKDYRAPTAKLFREFAIDYGELWAKGDLHEQAKLQLEWMTTFLEAEIDPDSIALGIWLVRMDTAFTNFPPKRREFVDLVRLGERLRAAGVGRKLYQATFELIDDLGRRYIGRKSEARVDRHRDAETWASQFHLAGIHHETVTELLRHPSLPRGCEQIILVAHAIQQGHPIPPDPDEAHYQAMSRAASDMHPLVRLTCQGVGSGLLHTERVETARRLFLEAYQETLRKYLSGELTPPSLDGSEQPAKTSEEHEEPVLDKEEILSRLDELLSKG